MQILKYPLPKITICFILGIISAYNLKPNPELVFKSLLFVFVVFGIVYFISQKTHKHLLLFNLSVFCISFLVGASSLVIHTDSLNHKNYIHCEKAFEEEQFIRLTIREKLKDTETNKRYLAVISKIGDADFSGSIILNIRKDTTSQDFVVGENLVLKEILRKGKRNNNKAQFDYAKYLENRQIYAQIYTSFPFIARAVGDKLKKDIWYYSAKVSRNISENLRKSKMNITEMSVAMALILGQRQEVSAEIIQNYQYAGVIHILSVSGLHVGIILAALTLLLSHLPKNRKGNSVRLVTIIFSLFAFALLAGLAPSIVRSVVMFSFVAVGNYIRRGVNIYHSLLVSMLVILLFEPFFLFDIGFQLSYIALFSIIWIQPHLSEMLNVKNKILKPIWSITTVSFAAQIGTLPLCLYYFHQFPGLFFIANLFILPFLSIIMFIGIITFIVAFFSPVPAWFTLPLEFSISYMNYISSFIASLEDFIIKDIPFNIYFLITIYLLIVATVLWYIKPSFLRLAVSLIAVILIQIGVIITNINLMDETELVILSFKKNSLILERHGRDVALYTNNTNPDAIKENKAINSYLLENWCIIKLVHNIRNTFLVGSNKYFIIDSSGIVLPNTKTDKLVLIQSPRINLERTLQELKPNEVIADGTNRKTIIKLWERSCKKSGIPFHSTYEQGNYHLTENTNL